MTTSLVPSLRPIADGGLIPESTRIYFRERLRIRLHQFLLREFALRSRAKGLTRKALGERIDRRPEMITRWLGTPNNMELDTLSDLLLAMGIEPTFGGKEVAPASDSVLPNVLPRQLEATDAQGARPTLPLALVGSDTKPAQGAIAPRLGKRARRHRGFRSAA